MSEIEAFPRAVLKHHYPETPLHGDFTTIQSGQYGPIDVLVGGTPCQSFSIAGLRGGLDDDRGNLALEYLRLADRLRPRWLVWENVPGVLSSNGGRDFGSILRGMVELRYGVAYRVLDAQYFGVAQRRRRVFVVGHLGDWRRAAAVLFEQQSLRGDHPPSRKTREGIAPTISSRPTGGGGLGTDFDLDGGLVEAPVHCPEIVPPAMSSKWSKGSSGPAGDEIANLVTHALTGVVPDASEDGTGRGTPLVPVAFSIMPMNSGKDYKARETDIAQPLTVGGSVASAQGGDLIAAPVAFALRGREDGAVPEINGEGDDVGALRAASGGSSRDYIAFGAQMSRPHHQTNICDTLQAKNPKAVAGFGAVRRLTPTECERLQGFPDGYTLIPWRKGMSADGLRYKALGNSMAVPCMAWIGRRIQMVEDLFEGPLQAE